MIPLHRACASNRQPFLVARNLDSRTRGIGSTLSIVGVWLHIAQSSHTANRSTRSVVHLEIKPL